MSQKNFKNISIVRGKDWFVRYFFMNPATKQWKEFRVRDGINRIKDIDLKEEASQILLNDIEIALINGYNPFEIEAKAPKVIKKKLNVLTFDKGIKNFIERAEARNLRPRTLETYKSFTNPFLEYLSKKGLSKILTSEVTEKLIQDYLNTGTKNVVSARTYNNTLVFLRGMVTEIARIDCKINKVNYSIDLTDLIIKKTESQKNKYYDFKTAEKVKAELIKSPNLNNFISFLYYSCMRPNEIFGLKVKNIDLKNRQILIDAGSGKTGFRLVPISSELEVLLIKIGVNEAPENSFLFGAECSINVKKLDKNWISRRYIEIRKVLGLDNTYTIYGWKHTRVVNLIYAGFSDNEIMSLTGHRDKASFEKYKRELVLDPSNKMSGKTIDF